MIIEADKKKVAAAKRKLTKARLIKYKWDTVGRIRSWKDDVLYDHNKWFMEKYKGQPEVLNDMCGLEDDPAIKVLLKPKATITVMPNPTNALDDIMDMDFTSKQR